MVVPRDRWLRAMGYTPWVVRGHGDASSTVESATAVDAEASARSEPCPPQQNVPPLLAALLQAAGAGVRDLEALGWRLRDSGAPFQFEGADLLIHLQALREQPAAKRALWRTLRALRGRRLGHG